MGLLPIQFQDRTEFRPLGQAVKKDEAEAADPFRDFEKIDHSIEEAKKLPEVTPEMAGRALRSLCVEEWKKKERKEALDRITKQCDSTLTWPTLPGLPDKYKSFNNPTLLKQFADAMAEKAASGNLSALVWPEIAGM